LYFISLWIIQGFPKWYKMCFDKFVLDFMNLTLKKTTYNSSIILGYRWLCQLGHQKGKDKEPKAKKNGSSFKINK
jgi:hypothetical protein